MNLFLSRHLLSDTTAGEFLCSKGYQHSQSGRCDNQPKGQIVLDAAARDGSAQGTLQCFLVIVRVVVGISIIHCSKLELQ